MMGNVQNDHIHARLQQAAHCITELTRRGITVESVHVEGRRLVLVVDDAEAARLAGVAYRWGSSGNREYTRMTCTDFGGCEVRWQIVRRVAL